jgi:hypothetical protein
MMKHVKLFEEYVITENAFSNFSPDEKKAWKKAENKIGDTYFVPSDKTEFEKMMRFLGSKNWRFWNTENIPGFSSDNIDPNKLPVWKSGIGFKLGGTRTGNTYVIPTEMKASTQGATFDYDDFSKVINFTNEAIDTKYWADYNKDTSGQGDPSFANKMKIFDITFEEAVETWNREVADGKENQINSDQADKIERLAKEFFKKEKWISVNVIHAMIAQEA